MMGGMGLSVSIPMSRWIEHPIDQIQGQVDRLWNGMTIGKLPVVVVAPGASGGDVGVDV
jgi:hypothetical protein